jgi:hypothetical protein
MKTIEDLRRSKMPQCEQSDCGLKRKCKRYAKKADTIPLVSGRYPKAKIGDMIITTAKPSECGFFIKK